MADIHNDFLRIVAKYLAHHAERLRGMLREKAYFTKEPGGDDGGTIAPCVALATTVYGSAIDILTDMLQRGEFFIAPAIEDESSDEEITAFYERVISHPQICRIKLASVGKKVTNFAGIITIVKGGLEVKLEEVPERAFMDPLRTQEGLAAYIRSHSLHPHHKKIARLLYRGR